MGLTSLQVCMDSSDWLQGTIHDDEVGLMDHGMDSSSNSPSGGDHMLTCSRPLIERRLRPPHDQALKCPRCESTHTKFCYYNNYSLSQPRYFCKTCRRYWTKGGTLRNIPVGGGCRKNKKVSKKSSNDLQSVSNNNNNNNQNPSSSSNSPTSLHLSIPPEIQLSHLNNILNTQATFANPNHNFMGMPLDFMESKLEGLVGSSRINNYDFMGNGLGELGQTHHGLGPNFNDLCSPPPFGMSLDGNNSTFMENYQRLMLPFDHHHHHHHQGGNDHDHHNNHGSIDVKPNTKFLSLDWQDHQQGGDHEKGTYGYMNNNLGTWNGLMNGYGSSSATANTLV